MRTHYDNLKVTRDAPPQVIWAAHQVLVAKYAPHAAHPDVAEILRIINRSYEVLSDPVKRAEHDRWIAELGDSPSSPMPGARFQTSEEHRFQERTSGVGQWISSNGYWASAALLITLLVAAVLISDITPSGKAPLSSTSQVPIPQTEPTGSVIAAAGQPKQLYARPVLPQNEPYRRSALAPNGHPWPSASGYIESWIRTDGHSTATIDNTQNSSDMLVELCGVGVKQCSRAAVRVFFVRAGDQFTLRGVKAGEYDFRYQDLDSGAMSKSEPFTLTESAEDIPLSDTTINHRIHSTTYSLTLYKVINGNTDSVSIGVEEF